MVLHNLCAFCTFSISARKIFMDEAEISHEALGSKSMKMVFVARIIRHKLCMIYALFDFFFVQKSFFDQKLFSEC